MQLISACEKDRKIYFKLKIKMKDIKRNNFLVIYWLESIVVGVMAMEVD